ncbi:MAG: hypothetical protein NC930_08535, partial [Candidatus Omnitrophica bacterium]|nr:hypothetical protein [Candidatus Omnitrophota bacterium]
TILDMHPANFKLHIELYPVYEEGHIAAYVPENRSIRVYADKVTDGIFAHEVAHAIMHHYFLSPPPEKVQEILAQYVDRHLWEDY